MEGPRECSGRESLEGSRESRRILGRPHGRPREGPRNLLRRLPQGENGEHYCLAPTLFYSSLFVFIRFYSSLFFFVLF